MPLLRSSSNKAAAFYPSYFVKETRSKEIDYTPSLIPPTSYWTPEEKACFFKALARYSRLQPELIQQQIGSSKQVWEVCTFIDFLDAALVKNYTTLKESRKAPKTARQISPKWINLEEREAVAMIERDDHQLTEFYQRNLAETEDSNRAGTSSNTEAGELLSWSHREALRNLDHEQLKVLDMLVRKSEENNLTTASPKESHDLLQESDDEDEAHTPSTISQEDDLPIDFESMTHAERRRCRKRIHMRRKRAEAKGEVYDATVERLKTGRKVGYVSGRPPPAKKHSARGLVSAEKHRSTFDEAGIMPEDLQKAGLDIFHLGAFGKLGGLISNLDGSYPSGSAVCSELLLLFRSQLEWYLTEILSRVLVLVQQERVRKANIKLFKESLDTIRVRHVRHVAKLLIGEADQSSILKKWESRMKTILKSKASTRQKRRRSNTTAESETESEAEFSETSEESADVDDEPSDDEMESTPISTNTERLDTPFMWIPQNLTEAFSDDLNPKAKWTASQESALQKELDEETALDQADITIDAEDEARLWKKRKANPGKTTKRDRIQSAKYVDDSEEENCVADLLFSS